MVMILMMIRRRSDGGDDVDVDDSMINHHDKIVNSRYTDTPAGISF